MHGSASTKYDQVVEVIKECCFNCKNNNNNNMSNNVTITSRYTGRKHRLSVTT